MSGVAEVSPKYLADIATNGVPVGYKQTEVGEIPEDWKVTTVGKVVSITTGNKNTQDKVIDGLYPFFVRSQQVERINTYSFDGEGVLTAGDGVGTGKIFHHIDGKFDFHQRVYLMYNFGDELDGYYFYIYFSNNFYDRIMSMTAKSSVDSVRREMIADMLMVMPPKAEQIAIANALFDVDALISEQEKLIAKKQAIKTATMQQLLTGRTRLPQFALHKDGTPKGTKPSELGEIPEDWEVNCFAECGYFQSGSGFPTKYQGEQEGDYPFFKVSDMNNVGNETFLISSNNYISESVKNSISAKVIPENAIVFAKIGAAIFLERKKICFQPSCIDNNMMAYIANEDKLQFKYAYLLFKNINLGQLVEATALPSLSGRDIGQKIVALPADEEQAAIATILSDMDAEILALEQRLGKTRQIKQGMMQELLTGKTRLIKPSKEVIHE